MVWVFGAGGAALGAIWLGQVIDRARGQRDERWANRLAVLGLAACAAVFLWVVFTDRSGGAGADPESHYRASQGSRY